MMIYLQRKLIMKNGQQYIILQQMYLKLAQIVILGLLIGQTIAVTALTTSNCPTDYNIQTYNTTSSSSGTSLINLIFGNLYTQEERLQLQAKYASGNTKVVDGATNYLMILMPFILIGAAFAITFIIALCCCVFQKSCPPCQSWKRDFSTRPYQKFQLKCVTIFTVLFAFSIMITAILGFVYFPKLEQSIQMTKCSIYHSLDIALNGDLTSKWGGFSQLSNQIGNISSLVLTASTEINTYLANSDYLTTNLDSLRQQNIKLYTNNKDSTVANPNPVTAVPRVTPLFISNGLGPYTLDNTMTKDIEDGIKTTQIASAQGYKVYKAALLMANSANNLKINTDLNIKSLQSTSNALNSVTISINQFSKDVFDNLFDWGLYLIEAILGFIMVGSVLILLGVVATHSFQIYGCKASVHLGWIIYGITYFGIVILSFLFFSLGGISYTFCQFYGKMIKNQISFNQFTSNSQQKSFNKLFSKFNTCLFGNGSISSQFSLQNEMATVSGLYAQLNIYLNMRDITKTATYVDLAILTNKITGWINATEKYKQGIYVDSSPSLSSQDNPLIALAKMNQYTNNKRNGVPPSCTNDQWVFDKTNCTFNATQTIYTTSSNSGKAFASTGFMCISFNEKFNLTSNDIWSTSDIADRYLAKRQCNSNTQSYDKIQQYAASLIKYRDSRINLYTNLKDQLTNLLNSNNAFITKIANFTSSLVSYNTATSTLSNLVTSEVNGIDHSSNCKIIGNNLRLIYNVFCVNYIYTITQFGICCLVLLGIMIGGMLTGSVFGIRYGRIDKQKRMVKTQSPIVVHEYPSQTFQRKQQSSESSSSDGD